MDPHVIIIIYFKHHAHKLDTFRQKSVYLKFKTISTNSLFTFKKI